MLSFRRIRPCLALSRSKRFLLFLFFFYFFFSIGNEKGGKVISKESDLPGSRGWFFSQSQF